MKDAFKLPPQSPLPLRGRARQNGNNVASNGFMMKDVNESSVNKAFCSTEYGTTLVSITWEVSQ
ncbi:MAG: hypothetical protein IJX47_07860 [Clostridia bacterium]|nr:hypothetical protein [Clostridia bacterium]